MTERWRRAACATAAAAGAALLVANALDVRAGRPLFDVVPATCRYWEAVRAGAASRWGTLDGPFVPASVDPFTTPSRRSLPGSGSA